MLTDQELFEAITKDDEQAFQELFERYWSPVYMVAFKYLKDQETCLDITHDIFLNIWNKRHQLYILNFRAYVITSASYHSIRKRNVLKNKPLHYVEDYNYVEDEACSLHQLYEINEGEKRIRETEFEQKIENLLYDLPKRCREIYVLSRKDNLSIREIAERLDISKRTVENQLTCALRHIRTALNQSF